MMLNLFRVSPFLPFTESSELSLVLSVFLILSVSRICLYSVSGLKKVLSTDLQAERSSEGGARWIMVVSV